MKQADMSISVDSVGNIAGTWNPDECNPDAAPVVSGSHLDSVPEGGIFDGPLGVYAGLEAVRAMQDAAVTPERPVQVVCFTGEEGTRFVDGLLGSSVAVGKLEPEAALEMSDGTETLGTALDSIGFRGQGRLDASSWHAWLELHVEQSDRLNQRDARVGIVTTISGTVRLRVTIEGSADHAGTKSMSDRTDALAAASEFISALESAPGDVPAGTEAAVATVGELSVTPNVVNVVPGRVDLRADIRDIEQRGIDAIVERGTDILRTLERDRGVSVSVERPYDVPPTTMADRCTDTLRQAATTVGVEGVDLHSAAGHDTMRVATATDAGLLFAPSEGGHSHSPAEWTDWEDCAAATSVLTRALASLAGVERND
jgi:N-carbamoyl-L-amino-acid hydrolase